MLIEVTVPQLPESVSEATLMTWHKKVGQAVIRDENLIDLETDKVVLELPAPHNGVMMEILVADGATVVSGQVIARINIDDKVIDPPLETLGCITSVEAIPMPSAAKLAAEAAVDLSTVFGSGRDGRVLKEDVQAAAMQTVTVEPTLIVEDAALPKLPDPGDLSSRISDRPEQRVPMSRLRKRVADRLILSQQTNAILSTFNEVNMKSVIELRSKYKDRFEKDHGIKLGFLSFFVKAVVAALKKYPIVNASVDTNDIIYHGYFDIGVAVGSRRGLVVPVIRNADQLSFADLERQIADFGTRAQEGKLTVEELTGGTYTISNGGTFGSMMSTPIINPPQSAILGMHAIKERPVVENGHVVVRPMMYLAQSYDHRIIDGREAVLSLVAIKEAIEDP
jgi:2-oxoglutarate dehydrogenase E2 component (dihydrolipoamide succinyltransferase)